MKGLISVFFLVGMFALVIWASHTGSGKYEIVATNGRNSHYYYTDAYKVEGPCVSFQCDGKPMRVCGNYQLR